MMNLSNCDGVRCANGEGRGIPFGVRGEKKGDPLIVGRPEVEAVFEVEAIFEVEWRVWLAKVP